MKQWIDHLDPGFVQTPFPGEALEDSLAAFEGAFDEAVEARGLRGEAA